MNCSHCPAENREGVKFCTQCGQKMPNVCGNCSSIALPGDRFCGACGAALGAVISGPAVATDGAVALEAHRLKAFRTSMPDELARKIETSKKSQEGERKYVSVLFADISGFTAMSELLDPEEVSTLMNDCFKVLTDCIYRYEGFIDKFIGDCIMALFGAPVAHENDPELAIRAALDMKRALEKFNQDIPVKVEKELSLHIGINSGMVIAGGVGSDLKMDYTVMGDTVNLASRLVSASESDQILVSQYTYNQTRSVFEFRELDPLTVKGKRQPVAVYEALRLRSREAQEKKEGFTAPLIGRGREFERVRKCFDDLVGGRGQIVSFLGDAGFGKSRMFQELLHYAKESGAQLIQGNCLSYGQTISYWIVVDLLKSLLGVSEEDGEVEVRAKLMEGIPQLLGEDPSAISTEVSELLPFLARLLSVELEGVLGEKLKYLDPQQLKEATFHAVQRFVRGMARQRPLLLVFENLHWADNTSLDLISTLTDVTADHPLMLLFLFRPEKGHRCVRLTDLIRQKCQDRYTEFTFTKLSPDDTDALIRALLGMQEVSADLLRTVRKRADGNPFYVEEVLRAFVDQGVLVRSDGSWSVVGDVEAVEIPDTVQGMIMSRIDRLDDSLKTVLQCAAAVGPVFRQNILARLLGGVANLDVFLDILQEMDFVYESKSFPEREYSFKTPMTQEVAYNSVLMKRRKELHRQVASIIEEIYKGRLEEQYELLAYHYSRAEAYQEAMEYFAKAGEKAKAHYANSEAIEYFVQASELVETCGGQGSALWLASLESLGDVYDLVGEYDRALDCYQRLIQTNPSPRRASEGWRKMGRTCEKRGQLDQALSHYDLGFQVLEGEEPSVELARLCLNAGWVYNRKGDLQRAAEYCERGLALLKGSDELADVAQAHNNLAVICEHLGRWDDALEHNQRSIDIMERIGDRRKLGSFFASMGTLKWKTGDYRASVDYHRRNMKLMQEIGNPYGLGGAYLNLAMLDAEMGENEEALDFAQRGLDIHEELGIAGRLCSNYRVLAQVAMQRGKLEQAREYAVKSREIAESNNFALDRALLLAVEAELVADGGQQAARAYETYEASVQALSDLGRRFELGRVLERFGKYCLAQGDQARAEALLQRSEAIARELGIAPRAATPSTGGGGTV